MKKNICIFCSSSDVLDDIYFRTAVSVGKRIAENNDILLFGGANVGMMKKIAQTVKEHNGKLIGIIPQKIKDNNLACKIVDELIVTPDMHSRKAKLEETADAFIALPGGFGTLEELSEVITLKHLGYHNKPVVILNINGFYNNLLAFYDTIYEERFAKSEFRKYYYVTDNSVDAFKYIENYKAEKAVSKWF
ncbi:MAG: TIGR00730 family Rossman fold protein [Chlorobi bacterium]|nr:TIGR00730 family Rossman fold protein [Chlorobiota bacterium]